MSITRTYQMMTYTGWMVTNNVATWAEARDATTATNGYGAYSFLTVASTKYGRVSALYNCSRGFLVTRFSNSNPENENVFQGMNAPFSGEIESARLYVTRRSGAGDAVYLVQSHVHRASQEENFANVFFPDFDPAGGDSMVLLSSDVNTSGIELGSWSLNARGLELLQNSFAGNSIFGSLIPNDFAMALVTFADLNDVEPVNTSNYCAFWGATAILPASRPYLEITYKDPTVFFGTNF